MRTYIHHHRHWPHFTWDNEALLTLLGSVRNLQGKLIGKMEALGFDMKHEAVLDTLTLDVLKSTEIEGERFDPEQVRSCIARQLGLDTVGLVPSDRNVDGMVEMMLDATQYFDKPLTAERLFDWHAALFPTGRTGMYKIDVGTWRKDETGPMQVVSGGIGKERVHFQAPDASKLDAEMTAFMNWFNADDNLDPVLKAALAHLWFVTIHPFDDGNGRMARTITDMLLAKSDGSSQRFYSMSAQIRIDRKAYYLLLENTQSGGLEVTGWIQWFLTCLSNAIKASDYTLAKVLSKSNFWKTHSMTTLNDRQRVLLNKLLDSFEGKLTSSKWGKIAKCSADTALRDIQDLVQKGMLQKEAAGGRSTNYELIYPVLE